MGRAVESFAERASALLWEDWLRQAGTGPQAEMLELAERQGFLAAPVSKPGRSAQAPQLAEAPDSLGTLQRVLSGKTDHLAAAPTTNGALAELPLPPLQRLAVWRALHTPDLMLLRARPATAAVLVAEIAVQAARHGKRVLLAASTPAALDAALGRLQGNAAVLPVRLLGPGEELHTLAAPIRAFTLDQQRKAFQAAALQQAQQARAAAEECCSCRRAEESLWPDLARLAAAYAELESKLGVLEAHSAQVPGEVERAAAVGDDDENTASGPFSLAVLELIRSHARDLAKLTEDEERLRQQQTEVAAALARLESERHALEPLVAARRERRWLSAAWWKAVFTFGLGQRVEQLDCQLAAQRAASAQCGAELHNLAAQQQQLNDHLDEGRCRLIEAEIARRQGNWLEQSDAVRRDLQPLQRHWNELTGRFEPKSLAPETINPAGVAAAQRRWQQRREQDEAATLLARQWANFLQDAAPQFLARLPRYASLVAGTHAALQKHAQELDGTFDLVVALEAERLLENDLLRVARQSCRWVLLGPASDAPPRPGSFAKLWQTLHTTTAGTYAFRREGDKLCCQLRPVTSRDRQYLESERLADFPEIELRIIAAPKSQPQLAQVVFPRSMSLAQAKTFIYRELQEVALQAAGRNLWLEETDQAWRLHTGSAQPTESFELDRGLREHLAADGSTTHFDFAKDAGWQRAQVDDWARRYLGFRDLGRTVDLS
jgi:hypothetical protein